MFPFIPDPLDLGLLVRADAMDTNTEQSVVLSIRPLVRGLFHEIVAAPLFAGQMAVFDQLKDL